MSPIAHRQAAPGPTPHFATIPTWCAISGQSRTRVYLAIAAGELIARKDGRRTLIDVQAGLARMANLPAAKIGNRAA
jgi:hypothetical protein